MCAVPPSPGTDTWPQAVTDSLGSTAGVPVTFSGATLVANDTASVTVRSVGPASSGGGTITGTDPFTFTPAAGFIGADVFPYEISDAAARTTIGIVKISVTRDVVAPSVSISAPLGGTVAGIVTVSASASDNAGVAGVTFFDGAFQIGPEVVAAPFQATWNTTLVADGSHSLSAVARDAAGNTATSTPVAVNVLNTVGVTVPRVVGQTQAAAVAAITGAGLTVGASSTATSLTVAAGSVISQDPLAGASVPARSAVALVVSSGPPLVAVPNVVGSTEAAATTAITGAGLTLGAVTTATSATVAVGSVISQNPVAGASVPPGSAVALVVSSGPPGPGGLVLAFGFEEAAGTTAINSVNAASNGTIRQALRVAGKIGRALSFDGINDWVSVTDTTASPLDLTNGMTLEAWVNPADLNDSRTIMVKERGTGVSYMLYANDDVTPVAPEGIVRAAGINQAVLPEPAAALPLNTWTHVATTYDGATQRIYVNGVLAGQRAQTGNIAVANGPLKIGGNSVFGGEFFQGLIDEVRIYNRALSAAEITADMTTPVVP